MKTATVSRHLTAAASILVAAGLLAAGCRPARTPVSPETVHCSRCVGRRCASEVLACDADREPSTSGDGNRCGCLLGARVLGYSRAESAGHCGAHDELFEALEACIAANCAVPCSPSP